MIALKQKELFDEIDVLPIDIKTKIVDKILNSIYPISQSIDELWIEEVNKRKNEIDSNRVNLINGNDVFQKIAKRFR